MEREHHDKKVEQRATAVLIWIVAGALLFAYLTAGTEGATLVFLAGMLGGAVTGLIIWAVEKWK